MRITQLRHLISLAESGSFSKAAKQMSITQPALSRSIQALEVELGAALFDRVGHRIEPTSFGSDVLERARHVLDETREIGELASKLSDGLYGRLRVGLGSGPGAFLTRPLLDEFAARNRVMHLEIARGNTDLLLRRLRTRSLDALVVDLLSIVPASDLRIDMAVAMRGAFLCRPGHPLARRRRVTFDEICGYPIASTPLSDDIARLLIQRYGPAAHPDELVTLCSDELPSLVDVTEQRDAILLAVRAVAPKLHELPMDPRLGASARFGLVTLASRSPAPAMPLLRRALERYLHD